MNRRSELLWPYSEFKVTLYVSELSAGAHCLHGWALPLPGFVFKVTAFYSVLSDAVFEK